MPAFDKILIANRGEIAVRIIRACAEMGIRTVAVYSDADRTSNHVRFAHEACHIGPPTSTESYLNVDRILEAAKKTGAQAVHPGYGFLAENANFARACNAAGLRFIGPPPEAMDAVGDKIRARALMTAAGVPVVPGTEALEPEPRRVIEQAEAIGYPVLIKAAAGGGGKGMRVARSSKELPSLLEQARGEASSSFGDARVFLEKFVVRPRHIEFQVLADGHGDCIHLGERECSIQRRHQKLIEESPSPVVDAETRERVGELAVRAVQAAGYVSAGTVEFLRDDDGSFYFMEVNARLQVEHPVTEMVTGIDLVKAMIEIAAGGRIPIKQEDVRLAGHAIECRIIAEDPARNFAPSPGTLLSARIPNGPGIRYDDGVHPGYAIPIYYDPMVAKLIGWGRDRDEAIARTRRALAELRLEGLTTSISFHRRVMEHPAFREGRLHTGFLDEHPELARTRDLSELNRIAVVAAAVAQYRHLELRKPVTSEGGNRSGWRWAGRQGWRS